MGFRVKGVGVLGFGCGGLGFGVLGAPRKPCQIGEDGPIGPEDFHQLLRLGQGLGVLGFRVYIGLGFRLGFRR